jgi:hypothetical protein
MLGSRMLVIAEGVETAAVGVRSFSEMAPQR